MITRGLLLACHPGLLQPFLPVPGMQLLLLLLMISEIAKRLHALPGKPFQLLPQREVGHNG